MRLLNVHNLSFQEFNTVLPRYAVASHRWSNEEISFENVGSFRSRNRIGYRKLKGFCDAIKSLHVEGLDWLWMDTTCIKQNSDVEVSTAVNAMFRWYQQAFVCLAYLHDCTYEDVTSSIWFTRGWTLQELIAPSLVVFYDRDWNLAGYKGVSRVGMNVGLPISTIVSEVTGIPVDVLHYSSNMTKLSAQEKWNWMDYRITTKPEDRAYCMLGVFGISMNTRYGEGSRAIARLRTELQMETGQTFTDERTSLRTNPSSHWKLLYIDIPSATGKMIVIVHRTEYVWRVKERIEELESYFPRRRQQLRLRSDAVLDLDDQVNMEEAGVRDGDTLHLRMEFVQSAAVTSRMPSAPNSLGSQLLKRFFGGSTSTGKRQEPDSVREHDVVPPGTFSAVRRAAEAEVKRTAKRHDKAAPTTTSKQEKPAPNTVSNDEQFEVKAILDAVERGGKVFYLARWGDGSQSEWKSDNFWPGCRDMLTEFHYRNPHKPRPPEVIKVLGLVRSKPESKPVVQEAETFKVKSIIKSTMRDNEVYYEVRWGDGSVSEWKWDNFWPGCRELLREFHASVPGAPRPKAIKRELR